MLSKVAGQLLFFAIACFQSSRASADTADWLYPSRNASSPMRFENQDTLVAAWTSVFAAPVLSMDCQMEDGAEFFTSQSFSRAHMSEVLISSVLLP